MFPDGTAKLKISPDINTEKSWTVEYIALEAQPSKGQGWPEANGNFLCYKIAYSP